MAVSFDGHRKRVAFGKEVTRRSGSAPQVTPRLGWRTPPECLNRPRKRQAHQQLFDRLKHFQGDFQRFSHILRAVSPFLQAHDVADDLGDRLIVSRPESLVDIAVDKAPAPAARSPRSECRALGDFPDLSACCRRPWRRRPAPTCRDRRTAPPNSGSGLVMITLALGTAVIMPSSSADGRSTAGSGP